MNVSEIRCPGRLAGQIALVVGGGAEPDAVADSPPSNGEAIASRLAAEGAFVAVTDVDELRAKATVDRFMSDGLAIASDCGDIESCRDAVRTVISELGRVDIIVCNVGISGTRPGRTQESEEWQRSIDINVRSHWLTAQEALPSMLERGKGVFLFISSLAALKPSGRSLSYEASKAAGLAVARHFGVRYADRGIRANSLVLGVIDSGMVRRMFGNSADAPERRDLMSPIRRQGRPEEVAAAAAFLVSDDASFITGVELPVDGGRLADISYDHRYGSLLRPFD